MNTASASVVTSSGSPLHITRSAGWPASIEPLHDEQQPAHVFQALFGQIDRGRLHLHHPPPRNVHRQRRDVVEILHLAGATDGFIVSARLAMYLGEGSPFPPTNEVRMLFSQPDGETLEEGDLFRNPEYAHTLQLIAQQGPRALLEGQIAADIVKVTHQSPLPGTMTLKDLGSYRAESADALCRPYRGYSVCVPPPPSSGVALLQMLAILDHTDIATRGPQDPQAWFLFAQASRLMYADRDRYVGDPHFVPVPVERMLDPAYVRLRAQLIGDHAGPVPLPGEFALPRGRDVTTESPGTSHFVVVDAVCIVADGPRRRPDERQAH